MNNKFVLPIGIDGENLINPLNAGIDTLEKMQAASKETGTALNDAFNKGASAIDKVEDKLKPITKDLNAIKTLGKQVGKEMAEAFSDKNIDPSKLDKAVEMFKSRLASIQKVEITVDIDNAKMQYFERQLDSATNAVDMLRISAAAAQEVLSQLDPNSAEYQQAAENLAFLENAMTEFENTVGQNVEKQKSLKTQLKEVKEEMALMAMSGQQGSKAFKELEKKGGGLKDQLKDINDRLSAAGSDTKYFDGLINGATGLVGAFTAVQGAEALFGSENKELEETLVKVNGAMAVLQGLQAVAEVLNKDSAFSTVFLSNAKKADVIATEAQTTATGVQTVAMNGANLASKALKIGLASIGIGLIIALVAYLVANWDKLKTSMEKLLPATKDMGKAWDELKAIFLGVGTALVEGIIEPFKIAIALFTDGLDAAVEKAKKSNGLVDAFNKGYQQQTVNNAINHARELKKISLEKWDNEIKIAEAEGKDTYKTREKWYKNKIGLAKQEGEDTKDLTQELLEFQARKRGEDAKAAADAAKKRAEDAKKAAEDAQKKREEADKKRIEYEKQQADLVSKYTREINALRIDNLEEGLEKERQKIRDDAQNKIDDLEKDEAKRGDALAKRGELIQKIKDARDAKIIESEKRVEREKLQIQLEGQKMILELAKEGTDRDLKLAEIEHKQKINDIEEKFKNESLLKAQLLDAESKAYELLKLKITREGNQKELDEKEKLELSSIEIMAYYTDKSVESEEQKQLAILNVQRKYAIKKLNDLINNGGSELEVNDAILAVRKIEKELGDYAKKGKQFDLFKLLGLDGKMTDEQKKNVSEAAKQIANDIGQMADFVVEQYQRQIDKKQEAIDQYNTEIEDLEGQLESEKELRDEGLANNVENIQKEIEAKKAQRDEEIKQQKELQEKQAAIRKAQIVAETAFQLVGMITSSVSIFKHATEMFGPFGVPIAIASVAAMFGAFTMAKIKAMQAVNDGAKFEDGGEIDGNSHAQGGVKYYSKDGKKVRELEGGEYVTNKFSYKKYQKLVAALNKDDFSGLSISEIAAMGIFQRLGVSFIPDAMYDAVDDNRQIKAVSVSGGGASGDLKNIDKNVAYLATAKKEEIPVEDDDFYYRKRGTRITKTRKAK